MDEPGMNNTISGPDRYLKPGERLLKISDNVRIKKFTFTAYITDQRVFLIDKNEKKPGITAKDIPREIIVSSILESTETDPFLVFNIRTSADESRAMKLAFVENGNDRTHEIEEWISILHGRSLRTVKPVARQHEPAAQVQRPIPAKIRAPMEKPSPYGGPAQEKPAVETAPSRHTREVHVQAELHPEEVEVQAENQVQDSGEVQYCHHCGKRIPPGANFCPYCGTRLHKQRGSSISLIKKRETQDEL